MKRFVEWYFGVDRPDPGQGTAWSLDLQTPWPAWLPNWAVLVAAVAVGFGVYWVYSHDARSASRGLRYAMVGLRLMVIGLVLLLLTQATLLVERTGLPYVVVLIDVSASMGFEDEYPTDKNRVVTSPDASNDSVTRLDLVKNLLVHDEGRFLKELQRTHKIRVFQFADTIVPLGRSTLLGPDEIDTFLPRLRLLEPDGEQTRPGPAVRTVLDELRGTPPTAIIVFSDGITTTVDADRLTAAAEAAFDDKVPLFTVGVGSADPAKDLHLYDVQADDVAFVDDILTFTGRLKSYGYDGEVVVSLRDKNSGELLASTPVRPTGDGTSLPVELAYTPTFEGEFDLLMAVDPLDDESNQDNNQEVRRVNVRKERIRVLLIDDEPRYEFRSLKQLLEREPTIELDTVLHSADIEYSAEDRTALDRVPIRREELFQYDVIVLGDVSVEVVNPGFLDNLQEFVREAGGGLIMVAGPAHNPLAFANTPIASLLPVGHDGLSVPSSDTPVVEEFRPVLTIDGRKGTPLFRFAEDDSKSIAVFERFPPLRWFVEAPTIKRGARVLAEHPTRTGAEGKLPVIVMQHYGSGKVLFHATDELWRWRHIDGDAYYARYWIQAIRFLSRSKLIGRDRTAELSTDRLVYQRGETIHLRVRFVDEGAMPPGEDGVSVMLERVGEAGRRIALSRLPQAASVFEGTVHQAAEGTYHAWVATPSFEHAPPSTDFRVEASQRELRIRDLDYAELSRSAKKTRGRYYPIVDADRLTADIPEGHPIRLQTPAPIPLWNRWELMVLATLLLLAEWLLRKRARLL